MKPICVPCQRFYRPKKNGFAFVEGMPRDGARPGLEETHKWSPYKIWSGDLWECSGCKAQIIVGTGIVPIAEHYEEEFQDRLRQQFPEGYLQVNDC